MTPSRMIKIFDTTLRDGEQSPGASMNLGEKVQIAKALVDLGVDIIEAGFPIASPGDFEAVQEIATKTRGATICGLARCNDADIDRAWEALKHAERPRIHVFLATSAIHRKFKLMMTPDEIIDRAVKGVKRAAGYCDDIEFSPEDAARTEIDFLSEVVERAIEAGATTVNIPDTVGYATPHHMAHVIRTLKERVSNIEQAVISVHCHNDLGLAVANSLAAIEAGAGQVECTINGIGERAGNCSLEEIVMAMRTRNDYYHLDTLIASERLVPTSRLVSSVTGLHVQRNKAIVGKNAFAHEAGIHQDGMLKEPSTYEIMRPEDVGFEKTDLVLGKHSGRAALSDRARALGFHLSADQIQDLFERFKSLADKKKDIYDGDIVALILQQSHGLVEKEWELESFQVTSGSESAPLVKITLNRGGESYSQAMSDGDGPIDAAFLATQAITGLKLTCKDFQVRSATVGHDALGEVTLEIECNGRTYKGVGVSTDTVEATIQAMLNVVNIIAMQGNAPVEKVTPHTV